MCIRDRLCTEARNVPDRQSHVITVSYPKLKKSNAWSSTGVVTSVLSQETTIWEVSTDNIWGYSDKIHRNRSKGNYWWANINVYEKRPANQRQRIQNLELWSIIKNYVVIMTISRAVRSWSQVGKTKCFDLTIIVLCLTTAIFGQQPPNVFTTYDGLLWWGWNVWFYQH